MIKNNTTNYIFCPFCGEVEWLLDKTGYHSNSHLEAHTCSECGKFKYTHLITPIISENNKLQFTRQLFSIEATIDKYIISLFYDKCKTQFQNLNHDVMFAVDHIVEFDWYHQENIADKIKTYVVFS